MQFTGQREDISGLNYYGARYYSSSLRHFTQPDPLLPDPYDPQQLNRYAYVRNNPLKYTDPSGNYAETVLDVALLSTSLTLWQQYKSIVNTIALGADAIALAIPIVPAGGGIGIRGGTKAVQVLAKLGQAGDIVSLGDTLYSDLSEGDLESLQFTLLFAGLAGINPGRLDDVAFDAAKLEEKYGKHVIDNQEFVDLGVVSKSQYHERAKMLFSRISSDDVSSYVRKNGETVVYDRATNEFGVYGSEGQINTFFRPDIGEKYFENDFKSHQ